MLEKLFELKERKSSVAREFKGALCTFLTMSYILFANPAILSAAGMPFAATAAATALAAGVCCILMGLFTNFPLALASGMGLNSVVAFQLTEATGSWQTAMGLVFWDGVAVTLLVVSGFREAVLQAIPRDLKLAIGAGIGLFIALIGLVASKLVVVPAGTLSVLLKNPEAALPPVTFGSYHSAPVLVTVVGLLITIVLMIRKVPAAILIGIISSSLLALILKIPTASSALAWPDWSTLFRADISGAMKLSLLPLLLPLILVDFFDTLGTVTAISEQSGIHDTKGKIPRLRRILLLDGLSASIGGLLGASSVTAYIESAAGVAEGARTGLHSVFVGLFFLLAIVAAPLAGFVPACATAPALILVGFLMAAQLKEINFQDYHVGIPAFLTLVTIPLTYSIAHGIGNGIICYVFLHLVTGEPKKIHPFLGFCALLFLAYFIL